MKLLAIPLGCQRTTTNWLVISCPKTTAKSVVICKPQSGLPRFKIGSTGTKAQITQVVLMPFSSTALRALAHIKKNFFGEPQETLSLIHISEPTRLGMISYAV